MCCNINIDRRFHNEKDPIRIPGEIIDIAKN